MKKFEKVQQDILDSTASHQLVSAGAGSGKTTVMIEKIANLIIKENVAISSLLVVTFTVLAGTEMKDRLVAKLNEELKTAQNKAYILSLIDQVKTASIDTIDGFSAKTIKKYFYELGISPNIEIISDTTRDYYISIAMKKTLDEYGKSADKINVLLDLFGGNARNFNKLQEMILNTYFNIVNLEKYEEFLEQSVQEYVNGFRSQNVVNNYILNEVGRLKEVIIYSGASCSESIKNKLAECVQKLNEFNQNASLEYNLRLLESFECSTFSAKECKENEGLKEINDQLKAFLENKTNLQENGINFNFNEKNAKIIECFNYFIEILKIFIKNYNLIKEKNNLIDFNDLNRLMLKLLENEKVKAELQEKYQYIFIDEYQDVNPLQDKLMSSLVGKNAHLFTVGDVKQSIYGFRGSSPEWFIKKYNSYKQNSNLGTAFDMNVNFRSNPKIMEFANEIFSKLMTKQASDIDYAKDCVIDAKRTDIIDDKTEMLLVAADKEDVFAKGIYSVKNDATEKATTAKELEAFLVLKKITELVGTKFYDANLKAERELTYADIAILSRSERDESAKILIDLLRSNGIPLKLNNKLETNKSECIKLVVSILKCVANLADDVDYLACFMALTPLTMDELVSFRNKDKTLFENLKENINNPAIQAGFDALNDIKTKTYTKSNSDLIRYILNEKQLRYYLLTHENGAKEIALLEEFLKKLTVESGLSLAEFIAVVESNVSRGADFAEADLENSVTIQTIHKSKGLEYPVVIMFNSSKMFQHLRETDEVNFNADIGLGVDYFNSADRTKENSVPQFAIKLKNIEKGAKEELRLLYVAITRAKNKLIITGQYNPKILEERVIKNTSFANLILSCYLDRLNFGENDFKYCKICLLDGAEKVSLIQPEESENFEWVNKDFVYANAEKFSIPFKNTVTGLNSKQAESVKFDTKEWLTHKNQYNAEEDRALVGTHYHSALEQLNLSAAFVKCTDFVDVDYDKIQKAHEALSLLAKGATAIKKEAEFMLYVPYNEIVNSNISDKVLVQGVVDLIIEKDNYIDIVDYKFSSLPAKILKQKYMEQLKLYKLAVEKAFKKPVEHMYIYSINTGELV